MHNDFFQGQMDNDLLYWPYHSRETRLSNEEEEGKKILGKKYVEGSLGAPPATNIRLGWKWIAV
jgi:hypothetical protein